MFLRYHQFIPFYCWKIFHWLSHILFTDISVNIYIYMQKPRCEYVWQQRQRHKCHNPCGYNEKWLKINFRSKTDWWKASIWNKMCVFDTTSHGSPQGVQAMAAPQGVHAMAIPQGVHAMAISQVYTPWQHHRVMQVVEDRDRRMQLSLILGCWSQWEYKDKNKFRKLGKWIINTTKLDT